MGPWLFVARNNQANPIIIETWSWLVTAAAGKLLWAPLEKPFRTAEEREGANKG